jgi:hypothetical protein
MVASGVRFPARYHGSKILYLPVSQQLRYPHFLAEKKKLFRPASFLIPSNSGELKCGLLIPVGFCEVLHKGVTGPFLFVLQLAEPLLIIRPLKPSQLGKGF